MGVAEKALGNGFGPSQVEAAVKYPSQVEVVVKELSQPPPPEASLDSIDHPLPPPEASIPPPEASIPPPARHTAEELDQFERAEVKNSLRGRGHARHVHASMCILPCASSHVHGMSCR